MEYQIKYFSILLIISAVILINRSNGLLLKTSNESEVSDLAQEQSPYNSSLVLQNKASFREEDSGACGWEDDDDDELPEDLFTEEQLRHGAVILHVIGAIYFFTLLAVVCNDYFLPAVECICIDLNLPKDVAAATFMATATTMPEFFTNTISTLITKNDMGLGTIIGSLMFNTLGVAAVSGLAISKSIQLDWWPVTRDCIFYTFNTIFLIIITWGGKVTLTETVIMIVLCLLYYVAMFMNQRLVKHIRVFVEDKLNWCSSTRYDLTMPVERSAKAKLPLGKEESEENSGIFVISRTDTSTPGETIAYKQKGEEDEQSGKSLKSRRLFEVPEGPMSRKIWWAYIWPIKAVLTCLIPNPKTHRKLYPITFIMCILFIGGNAYMIVWMLTVFGNTINVPDIVMGLTFLAAGAATPEALSSVLSVRKGESGIGVSNALGANSLAILLSLGVPWFVKNIMNYGIEGKDFIKIKSSGIEYAFGILLISTWSLFIVMNIAGFRLRRSVGFILISIYAVLITLQVLLQMNVFFDPEIC